MFLGHDLEEGRAQCVGRKLAGGSNWLNCRACLLSTNDQGRISGSGSRNGEESSKDSEGFHFEYGKVETVQMEGILVGRKSVSVMSDGS